MTRFWNRMFATQTEKKVFIYAAGIVFLLWLCILLFCCIWGKYISRVEIIPGMEWYLVRAGNSRIVWGDKGVVAEGNLSLTFCDDGIEISCRDGRIFYLDVVRNVILTSDGSFVQDRSSDYMQGRLVDFSAESVMGPYGQIGADDFKKERKAFLKRVFKGRLDLGLMDMYMPRRKSLDAKRMRWWDSEVMDGR